MKLPKSGTEDRIITPKAVLRHLTLDPYPEARNTPGFNARFLTVYDKGRCHAIDIPYCQINEDGSKAGQAISELKLIAWLRARAPYLVTAWHLNRPEAFL